MPRLGPSATIPRANGCALLAGGTRSRFSACGGAVLSLLREAGEGSQPAIRMTAPGSVRLFTRVAKRKCNFNGIESDLDLLWIRSMGVRGASAASNSDNNQSS
jgi:hypothetical protein